MGKSEHGKLVKGSLGGSGKKTKEILISYLPTFARFWCRRSKAKPNQAQGDLRALAIIVLDS